MATNIEPRFAGSVVQSANLLRLGHRTITAPGDLPIQDADQTLSIELVTPADLTIPLPASANLSSEPGSRKVRLFDTDGIWGAHPVTFTSADLIDGVASVTVSQPFAEVEFEWRGSTWHCAGTSAPFGGLGGGLGVDFPPEVPNSEDDEFNGDALSSAWSLVGATLQAGAIQRGAAIVGPNKVRISQTQRTGWVLFQPDLVGGIAKTFATMTQGAFVCKFSMDANSTVGPDSFGMILAQNLAGAPDLNNAAYLSLERGVANYTWTIRSKVRIASVDTAGYTQALDSHVQPFERLQISKDGTTYLFYVGSEAGGFKHLGNLTTGLITPSWVVLIGSNTGTPSSVYGVDYIRRLSGAYPTV